jgi:hypothetical protein
MSYGVPKQEKLAPAYTGTSLQDGLEAPSQP